MHNIQACQVFLQIENEPITTNTSLKESQQYIPSVNGLTQVKNIVMGQRKEYIRGNRYGKGESEDRWGRGN